MPFRSFHSSVDQFIEIIPHLTSYILKPCPFDLREILVFPPFKLPKFGIETSFTDSKIVYVHKK